ncbi:aspartyl/asparaginyl beta-hydroxylase-like isoform X1 [Dermacentor andersoni]|uniref:aspartyl/asparaginyl beta-hydroxylase-like isoform X1 n=1 Tax=Dermacentor andersoni TaxID=34620 RepID=UPI0021555046|nr:aspartyl/asparaginyl beta-hydroxylase-like isoform X1 [Dermacentor andersoni]
MSDREVRSRKKRKAALEKGTADEGSKEKHKAQKHSDSELEDDASVTEPSTTARITFLVVFVTLAIMVGAIFLALQSSSSLNTFYTEAELEANEDFIVAQEEMEVEGQHYATDVEGSSELEPSVQSKDESINLGTFSIDPTEPLQAPENAVLGSSQTSTPTQHFESVPTTDHTEVPVDRTSETVSSTLTETDLLSSTEILQPSEASEIKQDESDRALSLEATKVSEASSPPASEVATSTMETMALNADPLEEQAAITNEYDARIKKDLQESEELVEQSPEKALEKFKRLLQTHPQSPRANYGKALALEKVAELRKSNSILEQSIQAYLEVMKLPKVPSELYLRAGNKAVDRMRFRGIFTKAIKLQAEMSSKFPENIGIKNQMAVSYLMIGQGKVAAGLLEQVLKQDPNNGFAKVHYGFILKTERNDLDGGIKYMSEGIATKEPGVTDGRFYLHLGDALQRTGQNDEALKVYKEGVKEGLFASVYQRSLYSVDGLKAQPWWDPKETPYASSLKELEKHWIDIKNEALSLMTDRGFKPEAENLRDSGDWKQFEIFARGKKIERNCRLAPKTCALIGQIPDAAGCKRGQAKFSVMHPGTHVWAHVGPTNCRLRSHLGLVVPPKVRIRVANETREWKEGNVLMFDDSFEHEVWHEGDSLRLVLIVDFWHPDLSAIQKANLSPI